MATSAQLRDLLSIDRALPPSLAAHGFLWIIAGLVAAVATGTSQTLLCMYVLTELLRAHSYGIRQGGVTIQAGVLRLSIAQARHERDVPDQRGVADWVK
jgi:predicted anti-sigma-YlaC factor YlaD